MPRDDREATDQHTMGDVNKGSTESPGVRCRLLARDFKPKEEIERSDIFATMPPLEAKKLLF